jgi:hypothetical protein
MKNLLTNDRYIDAAVGNVTTVVALLGDLRDNYEELNESPGDDYDPERVESCLQTAEQLLGELNDLVP